MKNGYLFRHDIYKYIKRSLLERLEPLKFKNRYLFRGKLKVIENATGFSLLLFFLYLFYPHS